MIREQDKPIFDKARVFVYRNARPLDLARWKYYFENGSKEEVAECLKAYQNSDGGFGYGLEADNLNPHSIPMQTWKATRFIWEIGGLDKSDTLITSTLDYLEHTKDFDGTSWRYVVESNNEYPHASWWHYPHPAWWQGSEAEIFTEKYNPTASLIGFVLTYAKGAFFQKAKEVAVQAIDELAEHGSVADMHVLPCFAQLYEYIIDAGLENFFEMEKFRTALDSLIASEITQDTTLWKTHYIFKPSAFFRTKESPFYERNRDIAQYECRFIREAQLPDGGYNVTWEWGGYPSEWEVSKNWWKAAITVDNMLFLKNISE